MKKRILSILLAAAMTVALVTGCGKMDNNGTPSKESTAAESKNSSAEESKTTTEGTDSVLKDGNVVELEMLIPNADQPNREAVEDAMNAAIEYCI